MAGSSLLALLDDITTLLDDVALLSRAAVKKTAGVIGDDLALNAEQVVGFTTDRELPVIWAVAKGALLNKAILVPTALVISAFMPKAILPLMMIGGLFLCYEGFEKVWHKLSSSGDDAARADRLQAMATPTIDLVALERDRIRGAIRTDFILSAEIVVIALGTMADRPIAQQVAALSVVGIGVTVLVYGLVAGIVKLDDLGLRLTREGGERSFPHRLGRFILRAAPQLMRSLTVIGTAAMFLVGGSIVAHGIPGIEPLIAGWSGAATAIAPALGSVVKVLSDAVVGIAAGGLIVVMVTVAKRLRPTAPDGGEPSGSTRATSTPSDH